MDPKAFRDLDRTISLIGLLRLPVEKRIKAKVLQDYISKYGAVPDEYGEEVRQALEAEVSIDYQKIANSLIDGD